MKLEISAAAVNVGRDAVGLTVSVLNSADGTPVTDLQGRNFVVAAVQVPSSWSNYKKLTLGPVRELADGVYSFSTRSASGMQHKGRYAMLVTMAGTKGWAPLFGRAMVEFTRP
ncbi:MAG TPA: hypothetical protein VFO82_14560 [Steroidobacteraceae bacterium]|nr:hypothetical protein [Steroidobacteraceae bacterium]